MSEFRQRWANIAAGSCAVFLACGAFSLLPGSQGVLQRLFDASFLSFRGWQFLYATALLYCVAITVFYLRCPPDHQSSAARAFRFLRHRLWQRQGASASREAQADKQAVLVTLLKAFFAPMMLMSLLSFCAGALEHLRGLFSESGGTPNLIAVFNTHGYWLVMMLLLWIDTLIFTVGYLIELPSLKNEIRSVDPKLLGWVAALACYPPFNWLTGKVLGSQVSDFPEFSDPTAHLVLNGALLLLMVIYTASSVALGLRASNLTHRGIVTRGPYAVVRHPAYITKNIAWWIASIPAVTLSMGESALAGASAVASVIGWSLIYVLRALTEEDHLRSVDGDYEAYAQKVRYRFIPGIY